MDTTAIIPALILQGAIIGLSAAGSPGPFQLYLITQTLTAGWRRGVFIAFAPLLSDILIVPIILLALTRIPDIFLRGIQVCGGILLLYMAWDTWLYIKKTSQSDAPTTNPEKKKLGWGVLMLLLSPGPYLFWTMVNGPILLDALKHSNLAGLAFLLTFYGVFISALIVIVILFAQARRLGERVVRGLLFASLFIFVGFAIYLFWQVFQSSSMI